MNLFETMSQADGGRGMELMARQFNLSQQQAQLAVEALLPAFSQGLKQQTADPYGVGAFMNALATGGHAKYFENAAAAFSPSGVAEGNGILDHLFGSKEVSRAVAGQAALATGISQDILKRMLPVIASMIMGGMFKQGSEQPQTANNPFAEIFGQMMRGGGQAGQANPFGDVFGGMFGNAEREPGTPPPANPFGKMFEQMTAGRTDASASSAKNPYDDFFGKMFETGAKQQAEYQKGVESIFEQFTKGMDRAKGQ